ncbi:LPP20 family lipoprotein [Caminibacter pacificus]
MKLKIALMSLGALLLITGCSSKNPNPNQIQCSIDGAKAPAWVCNGAANMKDGIYAVGSAPKSPLGYSFQREEAMAIARDEIARRLDLKVKNLLKRYYSSTGTVNNQTAERVVTSVSKQLTKQTLRGSHLINTWVSPKGTMFVLVGMTNEDIKNSLKNAVKTTYKNDEALWQEFKAKKAQEELEYQIDKEFGE